MENQQAIQTTGEQVLTLSKDDIATLVSSGIIPQGTPDGTIRMFARFCGESRLSPFKRQVHLIGRKGRFTIQTGIDGYRAMADRTGRYAGNDDYLFDEGVKEFSHMQKKQGNPQLATSTVYKLVGGQRVAFTASARWAEYCPGEGQDFMWKKMPYLMLGKCAEALALRKAFPDELGGVYTDEEMMQAGGTPVEVHQSIEEEPQPEVVKTEVAQGVTLNEFNPETEEVPKGKYAGLHWVECPVDYLEWLASKGVSPEARAKAKATLEHKKKIGAQQHDDMSDIFGPEEKR